MNEIIKRNGIQYGLIIGSIAALSQVIIYVFGSDLFKSTVFGLLITLIYWLIRIFQASQTKKQMKNSISLKECFTTLLISTSLGILISIVFNYVFYNFIASDFKPVINEFMNASQLPMYKLMGKSESELSALAEADNFTILKLFQGGIFSILISSIFNIIVSAIFKSKPSYQQ